MSREAASIPTDNPIRRSEDDALERTKPARSFAAQVLTLDASEGLVVGVLGPWGSGKTSFVNLARADLEAAAAAVVDFNPWMFSGTTELIESFFVEIASQLRIRPGLADVGTSLEDYGEAFAGLGWLPLVGPWIERGRVASKVIARFLQRRKEGISGRRHKVEASLKALERPVVVVIDDIDRLSTSEIRDVFKLVRLTASFPNMIYVLAFDRARVEAALAEQQIPGRDYLEKILQLAIDLPAIPDRVLIREVLAAIDLAVGSVKRPGRFDENLWPDIFMEVIRPLIRNMRDIRRYVVSVHGTLDALDGQIALADVLALEAVRIFLPDAFPQLHYAVEALTTPSSRHYGGVDDSSSHKILVEKLLEVDDAHAVILRSLIERLFPAASRYIGGSHFGPDWARTWLRDRRVAHPDLLRLYLERAASDSLQAFGHAERAWSLMADRSAFEHYLRALEVDQLEDVIASLEAYEDEFQAGHVVPGTVVLMNLLPDIPKRPLGMFDMDRRMVVGRVAYRLLRSAGDQDAVADAAREILPQIHSLSSKWEIITDLGYREGAGHRLVSEAVADGLERTWRAEIRAATPASLSREHNLAQCLYFAQHDASDDEPTLVVPDDTEVTLAVLRSARTETRSQSASSRAVRRSPRLPWDVLVEVFGGEEVLSARVDALLATTPDGEEELLNLAKRYRDGWRPKEFGKADSD